MTLGDLISTESAAFPIHPPLIRAFGLEAAVFLSRLIWWQKEDGEWIEKSVSTIRDQTGLLRDRQLRVRECLVKAGILEVDYQRLKHKLRFRIITDSLKCELETLAENSFGQVAKRDMATTQNATSVARARVPGTETRNKRHSIALRASSVSVSPIHQPEDSQSRLPSAHQAFIRDWCDAWQRAFGSKYSFAGGKDGQAVKRLLSNHTADEALRLAKTAWHKGGEDYWWCEHQSRTVCGFAAAINNIKAELRNDPVINPKAIPEGCAP